MAINIYSVKKAVQDKGWQLLSSEYKNLTEPMEFQCPNGHVITTSYGEWREIPECDECEGAKILLASTIDHPRQGVFRTLSLDASSNVTGYALFDDEDLIAFGAIFLDGQVTERINQVKKWLQLSLDEWKPTIVVLEDIHLHVGERIEDAKVTIYNRLARLQGVLLDTLYESQIKESLLYASQWRKTNRIKGQKREEQKQKGIARVKELYKIDVREDEAEAILLGRAAIINKKNEENEWGQL